MTTMYRYGEIYYAELPMTAESHIQGGRRPVVIISNDKNNRYSPNVTVAPLTSRVGKRQLPTHVLLEGCGLSQPSLFLGEQIMTIGKEKLRSYVGTVDRTLILQKIKTALKVQLGMDEREVSLS